MLTKSGLSPTDRSMIATGLVGVGMEVEVGADVAVAVGIKAGVGVDVDTVVGVGVEVEVAVAVSVGLGVAVVPVKLLAARGVMDVVLAVDTAVLIGCGPGGAIETPADPSTIKRGAPPIMQPPVQVAPAMSIVYCPFFALIVCLRPLASINSAVAACAGTSIVTGAG